MGLNFEQYKEQRLTTFKEENNRFMRKLRRVLLTSLIIPIAIGVDIFLVISPQSILSLITIIIWSLILIIWLILLFKEQPSYKEYIVYYFWMGKNFLDKYKKDGATNEDRKKALYYFSKVLLGIFITCLRKIEK